MSDTDQQYDLPLSEGGKTLSGEIDIRGDTVERFGYEIADWYVGETRQGWVGFATVNTFTDEPLSPKEVHRRMAAAGLLPETPIQFGVWGRPATSAGTAPRGEDVDFIRSWPSVVTAVRAPIDREDQPVEDGAMILFCDPISYLLSVRVWGVFTKCSIGELLGGGLMLACGISGEPTLRPALPNLPRITITEALDDDVQQIPYAIASGEPLGEWLGAIFGRLGVRLELLGTRDGGVHIALLTGESAGIVVPMSLNTMHPTSEGAVMSSLAVAARLENRAGLLDNRTGGNPQRIDQSAAVVGRVFTVDELTLDQATERLNRGVRTTDLARSLFSVITQQTGVHPGRIVRFDQALLGAQDWQVHKVAHAVSEGSYRNEVQLIKTGSWTPSPPPERGTITVAGVIYDQAVKENGIVPRDELGRVPVRLSFAQGTAPAPTPESVTDSADMAFPPPPTLFLPVSNPMAGSLHGFVSGNRNGDVCSLAVYHPMSAEIIGFHHADHRALPEDLTDILTGVVVDHEHEDDWTGVVFRPGDAVKEQESELEQKWRNGRV